MTSRPKILFVNHSSRLSGAEFVLRDIVGTFPNSKVFLFEEGPFHQILNDHDANVIIANTRQSIARIKRDSNLIKVALPLARTMMSLVRQVATASREFDLIYANSQKAFIISALATFISRKPLVWHCHDILSTEHFGATQIKIDINLAKLCAACVIVPSQACAEAFIAAGGPKNRVKVLYGGIAPLQQELVLTSKDELRQSLGLPSGFLYGVFSRLAEWKGQHVAIEALLHINDAKCIIVGDAQFGENDYKAFLHKHTEELGVTDRVVFLGHRNDVPMLMSAMDAYCHPSIKPEPFGMAILEAMRAELPIIATNAGGIPEMIKQNITGVLTGVNDPVGIATALNSFRNKPRETLTMVSAAKQLVERKFTLDIMQRNIHIICEGL